MPDVLTDAELLAAHRAGDRTAFAELARRHSERMWGTAVQALRDRHEAHDAVQEALLAAHRHADRFRGDASVRTWLHRILVNHCLDRLRHARARPTAPWPEHDLPARADDTATQVATRLAVRDALALLPDGQRLAIVLVDVQGWSVAEAAEILEVPVGTVKSRCARGRARLAALLGYLREEDR